MTELDKIVENLQYGSPYPPISGALQSADRARVPTEEERLAMEREQRYYTRLQAIREVQELAMKLMLSDKGAMDADHYYSMAESFIAAGIEYKEAGMKEFE